MMQRKKICSPQFNVCHTIFVHPRLICPDFVNPKNMLIVCYLFMGAKSPVGENIYLHLCVLTKFQGSVYQEEDNIRYRYGEVERAIQFWKIFT